MIMIRTKFVTICICLAALEEALQKISRPDKENSLLQDPPVKTINQSFKQTYYES